jgi:hypothetical protein
MKIAGATIILALFFAVPALATDEYVASVFFTPDEMAKIATPQVPKAPDLVPLTDIHLGAVFYYGPNDWTVWINGEKWTPQIRRPELSIIDLRPLQNSPRQEKGLELLVQLPRPSPTGAQVIALKPYQTWQAATGKIVEGNP